ncbi:MAG: O-methyltransferase [Barnesiella sp.]|nr:O-methyltransferase [Bacteroidales bacterium]MBD5250171.1 O-methyltransferase [Barnesiella sp.]MBD5344453.1 O-methyltransferase [Bacteroides sp.]MDE5829768.1 O-methyltransferase [Duncaniella sp.]
MTPELDQYILDHISPEPEQLRRLYRHTHLHRLYPRMCSGHLQGRILKMLTAMAAPRRVIELGTYTGYSALCIAEALSGDAELHTIEINDEWADDIRATFDESPFGHRITLHTGDALELIPAIGGRWDMAYIDANKRNYIEYLDALLPLMEPGGFIIADNTLWDGKVADTASSHDAQTLGVAAFNDYVAGHPRLETVILPIRDGLTLLRVLPS